METENVSVPPTPEKSSAQVLTKKKPKTGLIIFIVVLVLSILGAVGVLGYDYISDIFDEFLGGVEEPEEEEEEGDEEDEGECSSLWWFDDDSTECEQDEFCGLYMYEGLQTFESQSECEDALPEEGSETGSISGSVGYPSEFIPEDMIVCAENLDTDVEYCEEIIEGDEYTYNLGYVVEVPYGEYNVYAKLSDDDYKAYYSEFVPCGMSVDCPSHDPITVTVDADSSEITEIDPIDWYN